MGIKIPFPKNYDRYIMLAQEAMMKHHLQQASAYFLKAYEIKNDFPLNFLIANTFFDMGDYQRSLEIVNDWKEEYFLHIEYFSFYVQLLLMNQEFLEAHRLLNQRLFQGIENELQQLMHLKQETRHLEATFKQQEYAKIATLKKEMLALPLLLPMNQLTKVKQSCQLPQEVFIEVAEKLLVDEQVTPLVRSWLLETLVSMKQDGEVSFLWFNNELKNLDFSKSELRTTPKSFQELLSFLEEELGQNDPILMENLCEEIKLFYAVLFPLADEFVENPVDWGKSFLSDYWIGYDETLTPEEKKRLEAIQQQKVAVQACIHFIS